MAWKYNHAAGVPNADTNYMLTPEYWEETVLEESWNDFMFSDMVSESSGNGMIVFNAEQLRKGGKQTTVAMRLNPAEGTKPAKGDTQIVNYTTLSSSLTEDMTFAKIQVYAGQERFAWMSLGRENVRMAYQLDVLNESAKFIADLFKQRKEESIIHTLIFGLSQSVTRVAGKGGSGDYGTMRKVPNSFQRALAAGAGVHDIKGLPHPNTYWLDESAFATITGAGADVNFDTICDALDTAQTGTESYFTVAGITRAAGVVSKLKIQKVTTPYGLRWLWLVPNEAEADIKSALMTYDAQAGPRSYGENRLWDGTLADFGGFLFVKSHYLKVFTTHVSQEALTGAQGYDDGAGDPAGVMAIAVAEAVAYPTLIVGSGALAYAECSGMSVAEEQPDLENVHIRGAYHTYGYRRADFYNDNLVDYFGSTPVANVVSSAGGGTPVVRNFSSALVMVKASGATM